VPSGTVKFFNTERGFRFNRARRRRQGHVRPYNGRRLAAAVDDVIGDLVAFAAFKAAGYDNRAVLDVLVLAATKLISNYTNHLAETPNDSFMKGAEWTPPGKLKPAA
jgi:hypothetical protein